VFPLGQGARGIPSAGPALSGELCCLGLGGAEIVLIGLQHAASPMALDQTSWCCARRYENSCSSWHRQAGVEDGLG